MWSENVNLEIKSYSKHHIDTCIQTAEGSCWRGTRVYGNPKMEERKHTWELLKRLSGYPFTWCNRRFGPQIIEERLDRALCSKNWGNIFQEFPAVHLETWSSDHYPIVMEVAEKVRGASYNKRTFPRIHYEDMWSPYEKCQEIVRREWLEQSKWDGTITSEQFKKVAKRSLAELKLWSRTEFGGREKKVKELINELKSVKHNFEHYMSGEKIKRLEKQIDNMLLDEEVYWKQRSRADWLLEGDRNTKFFHAKATVRKRKNRIEGVLDENGNWSIEAEEIERRFCEHFAELFTTTNPSRQQRESALKDMPKKVTAEMNEELGRPFTEEEIKEALF